MQTNSVNNQLNTECFLLRRKERCMTEFMSTVSAGVPVILLFLTRSSKEFEEKSGSSKTFGFSQTNYRLTKGFPYVFIAYLWKDLKLSYFHRPLRDDDFTRDLSQGKKFIGIFYSIFRGNFKKNLHFSRINIIITHL